MSLMAWHAYALRVLPRTCFYAISEGMIFKLPSVDLGTWEELEGDPFGFAGKYSDVPSL